MSQVEYRTIFRHRLTIPLFYFDEGCLVCRNMCLDTFGTHTIHCKEFSGFKYRHDIVRDFQFNIFWYAGASAKKKTLVNFLTDMYERRYTLRSEDVLVYS